ncbi:fusion protein [Deerpox virus W-848-83]|uniref:Fusion protein n=1 Tax=Deerpox virus (strain Mule deer/United States/W-848-83/1983) TaxID=305674 RepID=Q08FM6_DPV83|nr:Fusion protein [Deerpox virus W-848-83]ABI99281.1 fusion protein [Deerpox virus W-848-83]
MEEPLTMFPGDDEEEEDLEDGRYKERIIDYEEPNLISIRNDIKRLIKENYPTFPIHESDISDILKDSFIHKDQMEIKDFVLRLMVMEKILKISIERCKVLENTVKRLETHTETVRRNMLTLGKKIDVQTGRILYYNY